MSKLAQMDKTISIIQFTQNGQQANVLFSNTERVYWLKTITDIHDKFAGDIGNLSIQSVLFVFDEQISPKDIKPFHLVTLACLIHYLKDLGLDVFLSVNNNDVFHFIYDDLGFSEYWSRGKNYVEAPGHDSIFQHHCSCKRSKDF